MRNLVLSIILLCLTFSFYGKGNTIKGKNYIEEELYFINSNDTLYGKLIYPKKIKNKVPVILFVHGSGPEDYCSSDNYRYLWEKFTKAGFACFSWDRPGVGSSQGNWFEVSIDKRANEVINAINMLKRNTKVDTTKIGLWGISQAGWVIPKVARDISLAFIINVSSPVTTAFDQEIYRLRSELREDGYPTTAIDSAISYTTSIRKVILEGKNYSSFDSIQQQIKKQNWSSYTISGGKEVYQYLKVIFMDDQAPDLSSLSCPILSIWGENDLLVDPHSSSSIYKEEMKNIGNNYVKIAIIKNADHTLTHNYTGRRQETIERRNKYVNNPKKIFAKGYVALMVNWLKGLKFYD